MTDIPEILAATPLGGDSAETSSSAADSDEETASEMSSGRDIERVVSSTVPAGYTIHYCPDPRWYRIGEEDWETATEVPSVSAVKDILSNPALIWWGMKVGVIGVNELIELKQIDVVDLENTDYVVSKLTENKLTVNHVRDKAATRGTNVHNALEQWAVTGNLSDPDDFPEEEQGYVKGLNAFLADCKGRLEPVHSELMVGSKEYGYAGRFDLYATVTEEAQFQTGPRTTRTLSAGTGIFDLKTRNKRQKRESEFLQLSAYRLGMEESGYGRSQFEHIIQVMPDGTYDLTENEKRPDHFLAVKRAWEALR